MKSKEYSRPVNACQQINNRDDINCSIYKDKGFTTSSLGERANRPEHGKTSKNVKPPIRVTKKNIPRYRDFFGKDWDILVKAGRICTEDGLVTEP